MFEYICQTLREKAAQGILPAHLVKLEVTPSTSLVDLGIDSLGRMTLVSELAGHLSLPVWDLELGENITIGELADVLNHAQLAQAA